MMRYRNLIILFAYLFLALILTYPLVTQFADHVPGTTTWSLDEYGYVWNNWWFKFAVFDRGMNPFQTNFILYPIGASLVLYTFTLLHVLLGLPIQFAFGLIPASNAELLFAFVFSGFGVYLLARYILRTMQFAARNFVDAAAFIAGALFAFSSNRFVYAALGHYNVVATEWMPFFILFLLKTVRETNWQNAMLAGLFAACALYVELTQGVLLLLFTAIFLLVARRQLTRAAIARLVGAGATAALLFAPLLLPTLAEIFNSGYSLPGWGHAEKLLVDLFGFFTPTSLHPLNRQWVEELDRVRQGTSQFIDVNTVFLGYATLALATFAAIRFWKTMKVWAISALAFAILSLGPLLHVFGKSEFDLEGLQITFPLPFLLLHYIPLLKENRVPNRFSILVMLALAVLVGVAAKWILDQVASFKPQASKLFLLLAFSLILFTLLFEHLSIPLPLTDARVPEIYAQIARDPGDFTVMTLPLGWRNSFGGVGAEDTRAQFYQSALGKFIFPANVQRNPPITFEYFDRISLFHSLAEIELYRDVSDETRAQDRRDAPALMAFFDVRYLVINAAPPNRVPFSDTRAATIEYARAVLPLGEKIFDRDGVIAYRVNQAPLPAKLQIDFGTPAAQLYQGEGWDRAEMLGDVRANWANRTSARVFFPTREISDYALTLRARKFSYAGAPTQTMEIAINGARLERVELTDAWQNFAVTLPARMLQPGLNEINLSFANLARPRDVLPPQRAIGATGVSSPIDIVVNSGALGSILVNGEEKSRLGRGYNVVVMDARRGDVIESQTFDTHASRDASRAMTAFIEKIPNGFIVAIAAQESAAENLGDRAAAILRALGGTNDPRKKIENAYALIGVKGAAPESAFESFAANSAMTWVGRNPDTRTLAAAVSTMWIEKK